MGLLANTGPSKHRNEYTLSTYYMLETQLSQPENTKNTPPKKKNKKNSHKKRYHNRGCKMVLLSKGKLGEGGLENTWVKAYSTWEPFKTFKR